MSRSMSITKYFSLKSDQSKQSPRARLLSKEYLPKRRKTLLKTSSGIEIGEVSIDGEDSLDFGDSQHEEPSVIPGEIGSYATPKCSDNEQEAEVSPESDRINSVKVDRGDDHSVGSLFNSCVKVSESSNDVSSPKFDPSLFDIKPYVSSDSLSSRHVDSFLFKFVVEIMQMIDSAFCSGKGSRKYICTILSNFFRVLIYHKPADLISAVYIIKNRIAPEYESAEDVGVGDSLIVKAMAEAYGKSEHNIRVLMTKHEDLGIIASMNSCTSQTILKLPDLTIQGVLLQFKSIASEVGKDSKNRKKDLIKKMLLSAKKEEAKYIIRWLQHKLRIGVNSQTIFLCLADAFYLTNTSNKNKPVVGDIRKEENPPTYTIDDMEKAVMAAITNVPCIDKVVGHLLDGDNREELLEHCKITPGIPVRPMLAKAVNNTHDILQAIGNGVDFTCEYKYDGERVQLHMLRDKSVKLFSRNLENLCGKYPDVMENLLECVAPDIEDCILDCEVVAYSKEDGRIMPFQHLSTRKRKDVEVKDISVLVRIYAFDILYLNGESLVTLSLLKRRELLHKTVNENENMLKFAKFRNMSSLEVIDDFLRSAVSESCEGLMIKSLGENSTYEPQKRSNNWLKFKKDYIEGLADSIDLVPIGAFLGKGRRTKVYGSYLLAVYDPVKEVYQSVCKTGTGFSEQALNELYETLQEHIVPAKLPIYDVLDKLEPDVWFSPSKVWECRAADLSISPVHTASRDLMPNQKGIGLRFPRYIRYRDDKEPTEATTSHQIMDMYESQFNRG